MRILVTGATGTVGAPLVRRLLQEGADGRALTRSPAKAGLPNGVEAVGGDLLDVDALRGAMRDVDAMFLLSAVVPEELAATLTALNVAREARLKGLVYLSAFKAEEFADVPHQNAKHAAERMIEQRGLPATVLRPAYFMQNDLRLKDAIGAGLYPSPIGSKGVSAIDVGDVVEVAAAELLCRAAAPGPLRREVYDVVGPDALTGEDVASIWTGASAGRSVTRATSTAPPSCCASTGRPGSRWTSSSCTVASPKTARPPTRTASLD